MKNLIYILFAAGLAYWFLKDKLVKAPTETSTDGLFLKSDVIPSIFTSSVTTPTSTTSTATSTPTSTTTTSTEPATVPIKPPGHDAMIPQSAFTFKPTKTAFK